MKLKKVEPTIRNKKGEIIGFNLAADEANHDWMRSARLLKQGKKAEVEKLSKKPMYKIIKP